MNLFECIGGGSSELQETVLWTNSSPTSTMASGTITLSQSYEDFDFVKIRFLSINSTSQTVNSVKSIYMTPTDLYNTRNTNLDAAAGLSRRGQSNFVVGRFIYTDGSYTVIKHITGENQGGIILDISGLKFSKPKPSGTETVLWTNSSPAAAFAAQNVTLSDSINNYRYIKIVWYGGTDNSEQAAILVTPEDFVKSQSGTNKIRILIGGFSGSNGRARTVDVVNPTTIAFSVAYNMNSSGSMTAITIPYQIIGIS